MTAGSAAVSFNLAGRARLVLHGTDAAASRYIERQMDPFPPVWDGVGEGDVIIHVGDTSVPRTRLVDIQGPVHDGVTTGFDGRNLYALSCGHACTVPMDYDGPASFVIGRNFPLRLIYGSGIRPALQLAMLRHGAAAVHSACVDVDGAAVLIAGWSESGKTETALALVEDGASFLSDKWTVVGADGEVSAFPTGVGVRRWTLRYLPKLRRSMPFSSRAQFAVARAASSVLRPFTQLSAGGPLSGLLIDATRRTLALGDRVTLPMSEVLRIYGQADDPTRRLRLRAAVLLTNTLEDKVSVEALDAGWAARRLARSAAVERSAYFTFQARAGYADPTQAALPVRDVMEQEERLLTDVLSSVEVIGVRTPFPADPRPAAAAIRSWLG